MDQELQARLDAQDKKLEEVYQSTEKTRKYILWSFIITAATIVLPLIALAFVIPWFVHTITSAYSGLY